MHDFGGGVGNVLTFHSLAPMSFVKQGKKGLKGLDLGFQNGLFNVDGRKGRKRTRGDRVSRPTDTGKEGRKRHKVWSWTAGLIKIHFRGDSWSASRKKY